MKPAPRCREIRRPALLTPVRFLLAVMLTIYQAEIFAILVFKIDVVDTNKRDLQYKQTWMIVCQNSLRS